MSTDRTGTLLGLSHLAVGASALVSPRFTSSAFLLAYDPSASFVTRLFGSRDLVLGYAIATSAVRSTKRELLVGMANVVNAIDTVSAIVEWFKSDCTDQGALLGGLGAALLLGLGVYSQRREYRNKLQ
ncbi:hypothetical protein JCM10212_001655 [Sporobolomyces blumeae]